MTRADEVLTADVAVVGSGVAGLTVALRLAPTHRVVLVTKTQLGAGSSRWAQGGIAAAVAPGDTPAAHAADTHAVGGGLTDPHTVDLLTAGGPAAIRTLLAAGAGFERSAAGAVRVGREAGHSVHRIVHAGGDATGKEVVRALTAAVRAASSIDVREGVTVERLVVDGGRVVGLTARSSSGQAVALAAGAVVLATGGSGWIYANTTNPVEATGDGLDLAAAAGARLIDLEFVQFHPTAFAGGLEGADPRPSGSMPLLTEALRGAGASIVDESGRRFLLDVHPAAELAPRDVVARAIEAHRSAGHSAALDLRGIDTLVERFPTVFGICRAGGVDPLTTPVPVAPAAHYHMGGVETDADGATSMPGLYAVGEVACTGVHGANRLASNSLLEALVFGERAAKAIAREAPYVSATVARTVAASHLPFRVDNPHVAAEVRALMWQRVGVVRDAEGLAAARDRLVTLAPGNRLARIGLLVATAALARRESRGGHFRRDYPLPADPPRRLRWVVGDDGPAPVEASRLSQRWAAA